METVLLFARAFVLGIAVAAPVGAMAVLLIQRTATGGWRRGMATGLGIATADATYALAAGLGLAALAPALERWAPGLQVAGGVVLVALGVRAYRTAPGESDERSGSAGGAYASAVALTLANPMTIAAFAAALTAIGVLSGGGLPTALLAAAGVGIGSLAWWIGLTTAASVGTSALGPSGVRTLGRVTALVLCAFGFVMAASAIL